MSPLEIPVQPTGTETHYETSVVLDGGRYRFAFYTNAVDEGWYLDIENDDGTSKVRGVAMVLGIDLLFPYRHLDLPPGPLWVQDRGLAGADPDIEAFGDGRAALYYLEVS